MTIKQQGGIFGRNPTFNEVAADTLDVTTSLSSPLIDTLRVTDDGSAGLRLYSTMANGTGIIVYANTIYPSGNTGATANNFVDLGTGGVRFKDIYTYNVKLANGGGIDFSATSGTGTSELFDDYEEGEHTAVITATTSGTITLDSTNNKLAYTKVGRVVHVQGTIVVDSVSSPVGIAKITLPFTASNSLSGLAERSPPSIWIQGSVSKNTTDFIGYIAEGSNQISVGTGDSTNFLSLGANQLQASSSIYISVTYTAS